MWILVPRPGIEPAPRAVEAGSLTRWTAREFPTPPPFFFLLMEAVYLGGDPRKIPVRSGDMGQGEEVDNKSVKRVC